MPILKKIWERWKAFGRWMGNMVGRVAMSVFYFTIFAPFGIGVRAASDPLQLKPAPDGLWRPRTTKDVSVTDAARQF